MNTEKELRQWLSRSNLSVRENVDFGIKVWNSIEFVLLTKQEIIVDEFCNNLPKLRKEIKKSTDSNYAESAWQKANEFLALRYSSGAVSVTVKEKLIKTLSNEAEISIKESKPSPLIFNALLITLQNPSMQNYYKSNATEFARFLRINIQYLTTLLPSSAPTGDQVKVYKEHIDQLLNSLKAFIKQTPFLDDFKSAFAAEILPALCELLTLSQNRKITQKQDLLCILQELYFDGNQTNQLKQYLSGAKSKFKSFHEILETPMHVFLMVLEALILSFRNDDEVQRVFFHYLFNETDGKFRRIESTKTQLNGLTVFILLLKKYDVPLNFPIDSVKAFVYLGKQIEYFVNEYYSAYNYEVLSLLCATLKLNALILEYSVCEIAVKFMLIAKKDEAVWNRYEEFMFLLIEMYRKLSRAEKFISQLIKNLHETLSTVKLSKKLKRSFNCSFVEPSPKKLKSSTEEELSQEATEVIEDKVQGGDENPYIKMFEENILNECDGLVTRMDRKYTGTRSSQMWSDIAFAFTPAISRSYTKFIGGLVSKPSLVVWKTLMFTLKDYVQQLKEANGKCSENCIFLIEITAALLSQYFAGTRLAEQSDKMWDAIETNRIATRQILTEFGHALLNQEHNYRIMNAFLKLCYSASNFDMLCWYYRPDSMCNDEAANSKFEQSAKKLHCYLTDKEWITIEQRITNFGKRECKANINKIYLQQFKANQLFELDKSSTDAASSTDISQFILSTALKDIEQVSDILSDPSLATWFISNLSAEQKRMVCELLLQSTSEIQTLNKLRATNDWQFIEILTFATYKKLTEILATGKHSDYFETIDFPAMYKRDFETSAAQLGALVAQQINDAKCADKKLIRKNRDDIFELLQLLRNLPVGFGKPDAKTIVSLLNVMVYRCLTVGGDTELSDIAIAIFKELFHFGDTPSIFKSPKVGALITILKDETAAESVFTLIFEKACRNLNGINGTNVLDELAGLLKCFDTMDQRQQKLLLLIGVTVLGELSKDKKTRNHCDNIRNILFDIIKSVANKDAANQFIDATLPAFVIIMKTHILANKTNTVNASNSANADDDNDEIIRLTKLFLRKTVDCKNQHSVRLLSTALEYKAYIRLSDDEIKELITKYWQNFTEACQSTTDNNEDNTVNKTISNALKLICDHKSIDEWIELLSGLEKEIEASIFTDKSKQNSKILALMAKCQYNKEKGQIFTGFFKNVTRQIKMTIRAKDTDLAQNFNWIVNMLECYAILANNVQTPVSVELVDDMIAFLAEINVKKIDAEQFDSDKFKCLLERMCALCLELMQHRAAFIKDRVPHFVNVFKDLLQTIGWYKSNRSQQTSLDQAEITMLAEMAHNLEKTNKYFVKNSAEVKRVAPYLLLFVINLMINNDRPTTLYAKIKTHFEYICYDLIAVCDHRVEGFVLRNCNEASKTIYENLHREHEKYFKFKGKV